MIEMIVGLPGAGKGIMGMCRVVSELRENPDRPIITNLAIKLQPWVTKAGVPQMGLLAYLRREYNTTFGAEKRVLVINDDQAGEFYLWRGVRNGDVFELRCAEARRKLTQGKECVAEFDTTLLTGGPAYYLIDEAWKFFGSRSWQQTGDGVLFYASQHRKAGDDLIVCTQSTKQIDAALVRLTQQFLQCINRGKRRIGMWKQPEGIRYHLFAEPPTGGQQVPMLSNTQSVDIKGICQTYDTTAGVGLSGGMVGDIGRKVKGLPFWTIILAVLVLAAVVYFGLRYGVMGAAKHVIGVNLPEGQTTTNKHKSVGGTGGVALPFGMGTYDLPSGAVPAVAPERRKLPDWVDVYEPKGGDVYVVGWVHRGGPVGVDGEIILSNGQAISVRDCQMIGPRYCVIRGERFWWLNPCGQVPGVETLIMRREVRE